jgi:K+-transporting ATPase c subunit
MPLIDAHAMPVSPKALMVKSWLAFGLQRHGSPYHLTVHLQIVGSPAVGDTFEVVPFLTLRPSDVSCNARKLPCNYEQAARSVSQFVPTLSLCVQKHCLGFVHISQ